MGTNSVNLIGLKPGDVVRMTDGSIVHVAQNPGDGLWVYGFHLSSADEKPAPDAEEEPIFAQEIDELLVSGG